jgi:UDP-glucose 4-epimerase
VRADRLAGAFVAVTGGAGFIGSHLVERLLDEGVARLVVIDDLSTGSLDNLESVGDRIDVVRGDVCDPQFAGVAGGADLVYHLAVRNVRASIIRPEENLQVNATGTLQVLEALRHGGRGRFVYVSSSEIYGIPQSSVFS